MVNPELIGAKQAAGVPQQESAMRAHTSDPAPNRSGVEPPDGLHEADRAPASGMAQNESESAELAQVRHGLAVSSDFDGVRRAKLFACNRGISEIRCSADQPS